MGSNSFGPKGSEYYYCNSSFIFVALPALQVGNRNRQGAVPTKAGLFCSFLWYSFGQHSSIFLAVFHSRQLPLHPALLGRSPFPSDHRSSSLLSQAYLALTPFSWDNPMANSPFSAQVWSSRPHSTPALSPWPARFRLAWRRRLAPRPWFLRYR